MSINLSKLHTTPTPPNNPKPNHISTPAHHSHPIRPTSSRHLTFATLPNKPTPAAISTPTHHTHPTRLTSSRHLTFATLPNKPTPASISTPTHHIHPTRPTSSKHLTFPTLPNKPTPASISTPTHHTHPTPYKLDAVATLPNNSTLISTPTPTHHLLPTHYKLNTVTTPPNIPPPMHINTPTPTHHFLPTSYKLLSLASSTFNASPVSTPPQRLQALSSHGAPSAETELNKKLQDIVKAPVKPFTRRGQPLTSSQQRAVLSVHKYFASECLNNGPLKSVRAVQERTAEALGMNVATVRRIVHNGKVDKIVTPGKKRPNRKKRILGQVDDFMKSCIRRVIYNMYSKGQKVTLPELLKQCEVEGVGFRGKVTSLRQVVLTLGFNWEKTDNRRVLMESSNIALQRINFLRKYIQNSDSVNPLQPIFLDETWLFQRGTLGKTWQDKDTRSAKRGDMNDGRRFIVLHAGGRGGFVPESSLLFASGSNTGDYHGEMNSDNFEQWLKNMLGNLSEPSLIVMDNASYHSVQVSKQPSSSWKKEEIIKWLQDQSINFPTNSLKPELLEIARRNKREIVYRSDELIRSMGHEVLRLPPYHCHFNPIELIWATCKQSYNDNIGLNGEYTVENTKRVWEAALQAVTPEEWAKRVDHCEKLIRETWAIEMGMDTRGVKPMIINLQESDDSSDMDEEEEDDGEPLAIPLCN